MGWSGSICLWSMWKRAVQQTAGLAISGLCSHPGVFFNFYFFEMPCRPSPFVVVDVVVMRVETCSYSAVPCLQFIYLTPNRLTADSDGTTNTTTNRQ